MPHTIHCKNNFGDYLDLPLEKFRFRPSVYGFIVQDGKIVTMRNKSDGKLWFPGGGIEIGEKLEEALKREVQEETGLKIKVQKLALFQENFFYYQPEDDAYHAFLFFYFCQPLSTTLLKDEVVDDIESKEPRWTPLEDITPDRISDLGEPIYQALDEIACS